MTKEEFNSIGVSVIDLLIRVGFANTRSEARRHIEGGAVRIQDTKISDPFARLALDGKKVFVVNSK